MNHAYRRHSQAGDSRFVPFAGYSGPGPRPDDGRPGPVLRQRSGHRRRAARRACSATGRARSRASGPARSRAAGCAASRYRRFAARVAAAADELSAPASTSAFPTILTCSRSWSSSSPMRSPTDKAPTQITNDAAEKCADDRVAGRTEPGLAADRQRRDREPAALPGPSGARRSDRRHVRSDHAAGARPAIDRDREIADATYRRHAVARPPDS